MVGMRKRKKKEATGRELSERDSPWQTPETARAKGKEQRAKAGAGAAAREGARAGARRGARTGATGRNDRRQREPWH
jgi:hypothetical protein